MFIKSSTDESKSLDGQYVTKRPDLCVVETEDNKLHIVHPGEVDTGPEHRFVIRSTRPHMKNYNGKEVRVVRAIMPNEPSYSESTPQIVVAFKDNTPEQTIPIGELADADVFVQFDGTVHSTRPELKDHKDQHVHVLRPVRPGDDAFVIGGPYKYLVRSDADKAEKGKGKKDVDDNKDYVVYVTEIKPDNKPASASDEVEETEEEAEAERAAPAVRAYPFAADPPIGQRAIQKEPARVEG